MLYLYDKAICQDLEKSFNPDNVPNPFVKVVEPELYYSIGAQMQNDQIRPPIVGLSRSDDIQIDTRLTNFTRMHKGVPAVFDAAENNWYNERAVPIKLSYEMHVVTSNTADMDELLREITFKYISMYFLTIKLPYESNRKIRFGVEIDNDQGIERLSSSSEYSTSGTLYESKLTLNCRGCVLLHYTPMKLRRTEYDVEAT